MKKLSFLILSLLLVSACNASSTDSGGSVTSSGGRSYDPCELLTRADAEEALPGRDFIYDAELSNPEGDDLGLKNCFYSSADELDSSFVQLSLQDAASNVMPISLEELFETEKSLLQAPKIIEGIGTKAFHGGSGLGGGLTVYDKKAGLKFNIIMSGGFGYDPGEEDYEAQRMLAKKVIQRAR
jgi:hypothetical protein